MLYSIKTSKKYNIKLVYILLILIIFIPSCATQISSDTSDDITAAPSATITPLPTPTTSPTPEPDTRLAAEFLDPRILGSSIGFFCGGIELEDAVQDAGFVLLSNDEEVVAELSGIKFENKYYARISNLLANREYTLKMYYIIAGEKEYCKNQLDFITPKKIYTDDQVNEMLRKSMPGESHEEGSSKFAISNTQRALSLLDIPCGNLSIKNYALQLNQIKLEYSLNTYGRYTNWDHIDGECDQETVDILKDIISVTENLEYNDLFCPFVPTPSALYSYNKYDQEGGQFDAEQYLYDTLKNDEIAYESYLEYPFIYDSTEFQEKYSKLVEENQDNEELSIDLNHRVAENKFLFSYYNRKYMDKYAIPQERIIDIYYAGGLTVQTAVAFSYLVTEVPIGYDRLHISTSYRDYSTQAYFYTKGSGMANALKYGDYWHLFRQSNSYVPGFSNHQYGIAIDFNDLMTFGDNPLYEYLKKNANRYGFYNYYREAWHWVYLGE